MEVKMMKLTLKLNVWVHGSLPSFNFNCYVPEGNAKLRPILNLTTGKLLFLGK